MTGKQLEHMASCVHRSACERLVTLHAQLYTDSYDWCMCAKCSYYANGGVNPHDRLIDAIHKNMAWHKLHRRYRRCGELILDLLAEVEVSTRFKRRVHPLSYKEYAKRAEELGIKEVD